MSNQTNKPDCVFIGTKNDLAFHEIGALARLIDQPMYFADSLEAVELAFNLDAKSFSVEEEQQNSFICISEKGIQKYHGSGRFQAASLRRFIVSSQKNYPEPFTSDLLTELARESNTFLQEIPMVVIFTDDYLNTETESWLASVDWLH